MMRKHIDASKAWVRDLPSSRIMRPTRAKYRAKYALWKLFAPMQPALRNAAERIGVRHSRFVKTDRPGRQKFLLGIVAPEKIKELVEHLVGQGYGNHFVAWRDDGQVVSLRLLENFTHQYHLRIFEDGEVRGHYEYTPESYPLLHLRGKGQVNKHDVFFKHIGDRISWNK